MSSCADVLRIVVTPTPRVLVALWAMTVAGVSLGADRHPPLSPAEALQRFQVEPGLRIELVAAEPLVIDPVAFAFDARGRMYVVEGRGYPDPVEGGGQTTLGRIARLEDSDGDGRYDRRKEFASGLGYVNGIAAWRGGFFVTAAPDILYLKDNDGDGVADEKRVVLTGFDMTKTAQIRVSHPTFGPDGKFYLTSGLNGGKVTSPLHPERPPVTFNSRDSRFDPNTFEFEITGGRGQFGLAFDSFGRRFITTNRHPVLQVMLEPWHLRRNPHLAFTDTTQEVSKVEAEAKVFPISRSTIAADFIPKLMSAPHSGTFTSACGLIVFGGTALTPDHVGNVFICEPAQNLVQRQVFRAEGASLRSDPPYNGREFLRSNDVWFRPVFLGDSPDGALYVADMYRREIDHPRYIPEESRGLLDFESGKDRGRIYRIVREGAGSRPRPADGKAVHTTAELVRDLESPEVWWREYGHRLLLETGDRAAIQPLEKLATGARLPETRIRALWVLQGLKAVTRPMVEAAMRDPHAGVREQAIALAGELLRDSPALLGRLVAAAEDENARVRHCAALVLGSVEDPAAVPALAAIAARDGDDRWTRAAVLSGVGARLEPFLQALRERRGANARAFAAVMEDLGRVFGAGATPDACAKFLSQVLSAEGELAWRLSSALGLADGLRSRAGAKANAEKNPLVGLPGMGNDGKAAGALQAFLGAARNRASDPQAPTSERITAVSLLGYTDMAFAGEALGALLDARQPPELQLQAVRALDRIGDPRGGSLLIAKENWTRYTPRVREAVLAALTSKPAMIEILFGAIRSGVIAPAEISSVRRTNLLQHRDAAVKKEAATIFKAIEGGDRMEVYRTYREALQAKPDLALGRAAFTRACSACHTYEGTGGKVGPDLTGIRNQPADAILLHILVPNYEVAPSYQTISITTRDGSAVSGWISAESESSITLKTAAGTEETILRSNIAALNASGVSLMPDGLELTMTKDEVSGLVAYLKSAK